jgi:hypothetical protein
MKTCYSTLKYFLILGLAVCGIAHLNAATSFNDITGGNVADGNNWDNGIPNVGNDGTIAMDGAIETFDFYNDTAGTVAISHTAGTLTCAGQINLHNYNGTTPYQWTQSGGTVSASDIMMINSLVTYELSGTGLIEFTGTEGGIHLVSTAAFVQSGGTTDGMALDFENAGQTNTLSGGVGMDVGGSWPGVLALRVLNSTLNISGSYSATFNAAFVNPTGTTNGTLCVDTGVLNFNSNWTGSLTQSAFSGTTNWQTALTQTGVKVDGAQVTAVNFANYFSVTENGTVVKLTVPGTRFVSGNIAIAGNWTNGLPSVDNNGLIAASGSLGALNFSTSSVGTATVSHTAGTIAGTVDMQNSGATLYKWTQSGGTVTLDYFMNIRNRVSYELTGTGLLNYSAGRVGGDRLIVSGTGSWSQSGGTTDGVSLDFESSGTNILSGGVGLNVGGSWADTRALRLVGSTVTVTGSYSATFYPGRGIGLESGSVLKISPTWTGSFTQSTYSGTQWQTALTQTGVRVNGVQVSTENFATFFEITEGGTVVKAVPLPSGGTHFVSGDVATAGNWDNGLPAPGNDGAIAASGTLNTFDLNVADATVVTQTDGILTGIPNIQNSGAGTVLWTQNYGTVSATDYMVINDKVTYVLTGAGLIQFASTTTDSRLLINGSGSFLQHGGTIDGMALDFANTGLSNTLSSGEGLNVGASSADGVAIRVADSTVNVTGDYRATIHPHFINATGIDHSVLSVESVSGTGILNFSSTWTGSLTQSAFNGTTLWQDALTQTGVQVDGTQVTVGNFSTYFAIYNHGATVTRVGSGFIEGTRLISGDLAISSHWSHNLPSPGTDGLIAVSGTLNSLSLNVAAATVVTQTAGTLTGTPNIQNTGAGTVAWTQSGGTVAASNFMVVNNKVAYELTGSGLIYFTSSTGGSRLQVVNTGSWVQSGGTTEGLALAFENSGGSNTLSGGAGYNVGASWAGGAAIRIVDSTVNITGGYSATIHPAFINAGGLDNGVLSMEGTAPVLNFSSTWSGSLSQSAFTGTQWQGVLTQTGVKVDGTQVTAGNFADFFVIVDNGMTVAKVGTSVVTAGTRLIGGNIANAAHWTNGLPAVGKDGSIAALGTINQYDIDFSNSTGETVVISQTAGTITGTDINLRNTGTTVYRWTQSGGTVSARNFLVINDRVAYELTGTGLINFSSTIGGSRFQVVNASSFVQSGGTTDGMALAFENSTGTNTLSGGSGLNVGASWAGGAAIRIVGSTVNLTGSYSAVFNSGFVNPTGTTNSVLCMQTGDLNPVLPVFNISSTWTGSLTQSAFAGGTKWQTALTQTGVQVDGTQVTAENFGSFFELTNDGATVAIKAAAPGYAGWEIENDIVGAGAAADSDGDGISNGIEFVIGGDPSGPNSDSSALLVPSTLDAEYLNFVFRRISASAIYNPSVVYGSNLSDWTPAVADEPVAHPVLITVDADYYGGGTDRVTVRIPRALAPDNKLFARLQVAITP